MTSRCTVCGRKEHSTQAHRAADEVSDKREAQPPASPADPLVEREALANAYGEASPVAAQQPEHAFPCECAVCSPASPVAPAPPTLTFDGIGYHCARCGSKQFALCEHWQALFERAHAAINMGRMLAPVATEEMGLPPAVYSREIEQYRKTMHAKFGYVAGPDGKCACAYCVKDIDALMERSAELEMENHCLREKLAAQPAGTPERPDYPTPAETESLRVAYQSGTPEQVREALLKVIAICDEPNPSHYSDYIYGAQWVKSQIIQILNAAAPQVQQGEGEGNDGR